jgi:3-oxoacyl-[acyl-carrier-protein] synthase II
MSASRGSTERRRVVVTGLGAVTPVGNTVPEMWASLVAGRGGVGLVTRFDVSAFPGRLAAEVKNFDLSTAIEPRTARRTDPFVQFGLAAAKEALRHSGLVIDESNRDRVGVVFGSGIGGIKSWDDNHAILNSRGPGRVSPFLIPMLIGNMAAGMVSIELGARGPNKAVQTACATSSNCIGDAMRLIQYGEADAVIAGGSEAAIEPLAYAGFCSMKAFSTRNDDPEGASRPFDKGRDGFIMGEGGGAVVLESLESAEARGADILAEMVGYGMSGDAYHIAAPHPQGEGAARAMAGALADAGLSADQLDYINAHATSTPTGDTAEVNAIRHLFANGHVPVPVSSTKSMTGHLLGAAGAVELVVCVLAIRDSVLPPTINYETPDPDCDLDCVPNSARTAEVRVAMSNSFGFGGHNCSLVVRAF